MPPEHPHPTSFSCIPPEPLTSPFLVFRFDLNLPHCPFLVFTSHLNLSNPLSFPPHPTWSFQIPFPCLHIPPEPLKTFFLVSTSHLNTHNSPPFSPHPTHPLILLLVWAQPGYFQYPSPQTKALLKAMEGWKDSGRTCSQAQTTHIDLLLPDWWSVLCNQNLGFLSSINW